MNINNINNQCRYYYFYMKDGEVIFHNYFFTSSEIHNIHCKLNIADRNEIVIQLK